MKKELVLFVIFVCISMYLLDTFSSIPDFIFTNLVSHWTIWNSFIPNVTFVYSGFSILATIFFVLLVFRKQMKITFPIYIVVIILTVYAWIQMYIELYKDNHGMYQWYVLGMWMFSIAWASIFIIALSYLFDYILLGRGLRFPSNKVEKRLLWIASFFFLSWLLSLLIFICY